MKITVITLITFLAFNISKSYKDKNINQIMEIQTEAKVQSASGIDVFLKDPSNYTFLCTSTSKGEVLEASITPKGELTILYESFWDDGDHSGVTKGIYNRKKNKFNGRYQTKDGRFSGEINFSFNEKGEADGSWDNGYGIIKIHLKK
jgi:hypothetical protein